MIPATPQLGPFCDEEVKKIKENGSVIADFLSPCPEILYVGAISLKKFLKDNKSDVVIRLRKILEKTDLTEFRKKYHPSGRRPVDPVITLGLILFGIMEGKWSLRELETLSKMDVRAWWLCGGVTLDHSTIGKFILKHDELLRGEYFEELTRVILKELNIGRTDVSGDGTTIEAMSSRYKLLRAEALKEQLLKAQATVEANPNDEKAREKTARLREAERILKKQEAKNKKKGTATDKITVHPGEPEARTQPLKNKTNRPSYKPSVLANEHKLIVGQQVEPTSETKAIAPMLKQHERIVGVEVGRLLLDAGYSNSTVFEEALKLFVEIGIKRE